MEDSCHGRRESEGFLKTDEEGQYEEGNDEK